MPPQRLVVLTTLGDADEARTFVRRLVDDRLVACGTPPPGGGAPHARAGRPGGGCRPRVRWGGPVAAAPPAAPVDPPPVQTPPPPRRDDPESALAELDAALDEHPDDPTLLLQRARVHVGAGN